MQVLTKTDLQLCVSRVPKDIRELMNKYKLFVGGGFIRSTIARERVNDIDLFGSNRDTLERAANHLRFSRSGRIHTTSNAFTVLSSVRTPAQFITKWLYTDGEQLCNDFDFTVCQAVIWFDVEKGWQSSAGDSFYSDLAARRLVYTFPQREEAAGGSMIRVRKFLGRGYNIQTASLAGVISRLVLKIDMNSVLVNTGEKGLAKVITGLLREVDPLVVIDGFEAVDEHEMDAFEGRE